MAYHWDDWGNLAELRRLDGTVIVRYDYDAEHRRVRKLTTAAAPQGATATLYHYDERGQLLAETGEDGVARITYLWRDAVLSGLITHQPSRTVYTVETDHLGSPFQVRSLAGQVRWRWTSQAFGATPPNEDVGGDGVRLSLNLRFPGQYFDAESGLHYNWHRYYDPSTGRYLSADPIGLAGGWNTFGYVGGNPLGAIDPEGLTTLAWCFGGPVPCAVGVGATVAAAGWGVWSSGQNMPVPIGDYSPWSSDPLVNERFVNDRDAVKEFDVAPPPYQDPNKPDCDELRSRIKHYDRAIKAREVLTQRWYDGILNPGHAKRIEILKRDRERIQRRLDRGDCKPC